MSRDAADAEGAQEHDDDEEPLDQTARPSIGNQCRQRHTQAIAHARFDVNPSQAAAIPASERKNARRYRGVTVIVPVFGVMASMRK